MTTLNDTLARLKKEKEDAEAAEAQKPYLIEEWQTAVTALLSDLKSFLSSFERDGSISISESSVPVSEDFLGTYVVKTVTLTAGPLDIAVIPAGRIVFGAIGRVDLIRRDRRNAPQAALIRRGDQDGHPVGWVFKIPEGWDSVQNVDFYRGFVPINEVYVDFNEDTTLKIIDFMLNLQ